MGALALTPIDCLRQPRLELSHPLPHSPDVPLEKVPPRIIRLASRELLLIPRQLGRQFLP